MTRQEIRKLSKSKLAKVARELGLAVDADYTRDDLADWVCETVCPSVRAPEWKPEYADLLVAMSMG